MTLSQVARQRESRPKRAPGEAYSNQSYGEAVASGCKKAGVAHWPPPIAAHGCHADP